MESPRACEKGGAGANHAETIAQRSARANVKPRCACAWPSHLFAPDIRVVGSCSRWRRGPQRAACQIWPRHPVMARSHAMGLRLRRSEACSSNPARRQIFGRHNEVEGARLVGVHKTRLRAKVEELVRACSVRPNLHSYQGDATSYSCQAVVATTFSEKRVFRRGMLLQEFLTERGYIHPCRGSRWFACGRCHSGRASYLDCMEQDLGLAHSLLSVLPGAEVVAAKRAVCHAPRR